MHSPFNLTTADRGAVGELLAAAWLVRQGYAVFRNVSATGPADLVTIDATGLVGLVDVKARALPPRFELRSDVQVALGVRFLAVDLDTGACAWMPEAPPARGHGLRICKQCEAEFAAPRANSKFCSAECSRLFWATMYGNEYQREHYKKPGVRERRREYEKDRKR